METFADVAKALAGLNIGMVLTDPEHRPELLLGTWLDIFRPSAEPAARNF